MQGYLFMPYFPMAEPNLTLSGKRRDDLPDDVAVHYYHNGYWTLDELHRYGALPEIEPKI
jgi:hypothetical protein